MPPTTNAHPPKPAPTKAAPINIKLLLIGNSSVGKSSLLLRFSDEAWLPEDEASATIGVDFRVHRMSVALDDEQKPPIDVKLSIWDTAGQERFRTITASYYRGAQGVVLVYDVASRESFESLPRWWDELETYLGGEGRDAVVKIVVGNKEFSRQVSTAEGQGFATRMGCFFVESSAKTDVGVTEAFTEVVKRILLNNIARGAHHQHNGWRTDHGRGGVPGGVQVIGAPEQPTGGCAC
ncbi:ras-domain-containing protein [Hymenopellis radicata]|nr:ras-domain-containing protein [Hymenopellis radicata]